ncbi:MAG: hypothetical protein OEY36_04365 [Gammaproteobacteria bacterium]|nr:hypothetical protein [Gammaproteobacteria bacterium]
MTVNKLIRLAIAVLIAVPFTAAAIIFGLYGMLFGVAGITSADPVAIFLGVVTIAGLAGIAGGWRRLLKSSVQLTQRERNRIRMLLYCGLASSLSLFCFFAYLKLAMAAFILFIMTLLNVAFIYVTPKQAGK